MYASCSSPRLNRLSAAVERIEQFVSVTSLVDMPKTRAVIPLKPKSMGRQTSNCPEKICRPSIPPAASENLKAKVFFHLQNRAFLTLFFRPRQLDKTGTASLEVLPCWQAMPFSHHSDQDRRAGPPHEHSNTRGQSPVLPSKETRANHSPAPHRSGGIATQPRTCRELP